VEPVEFERDRRRLWGVGIFSLVVAVFAVVLLATAFGTDAGFEVFGIPVPEVVWIVIWGAMAGFAGMAAVRSLRGARDDRPGLEVDDDGIGYYLEMLGEGRRIVWEEVAGVERKRVNRQMEVVRIHTTEGRRFDLRADLLESASTEDVLAAIDARRPR
jgi:hypothetical protein